MSRNTIVLFFSDNGGIPRNGSNGLLRGGKVTTFEGGIRVPAVIRWPAGLKGGRTSTQVMSVLDLFPTLCAACGIEERNTKPLDGKNMWPAITSGRSNPREDLFFAVGIRETIYLAVHRREWKLVRRVRKADLNTTDFFVPYRHRPK